MDPWANTWADDDDDAHKQSMTFPGLGLPPAPDPLPSLSAFDTPAKASLDPASDNAWADPEADGLAKKMESSWPGESPSAGAGIHNNPGESSPRPNRLSWNPETDDGFITADQSLDGSPADRPDKDSYFYNTRPTPPDVPWATGQDDNKGEEEEENEGSPVRAASDASSSESPEQEDDHGDWGKMDLPPLTQSPRVHQEPEEDDQGLHKDDGAWGAMDLPPLPSENPDALPVWDSKEAPLPAKKPQEQESEESEEEPEVDNNMHANDLWAALVDPSEPRAFLTPDQVQAVLDKFRDSTDSHDKFDPDAWSEQLEMGMDVSKAVFEPGGRLASLAYILDVRLRPEDCQDAGALNKQPTEPKASSKPTPAPATQPARPNRLSSFFRGGSGKTPTVSDIKSQDAAPQATSGGANNGKGSAPTSPATVTSPGLRGSFGSFFSGRTSTDKPPKRATSPPPTSKAPPASTQPESVVPKATLAKSAAVPQPPPPPNRGVRSFLSRFSSTTTAKDDATPGGHEPNRRVSTSSQGEGDDGWLSKGEMDVLDRAGIGSSVRSSYQHSQSTTQATRRARPPQPQQHQEDDDFFAAFEAAAPPPPKSRPSSSIGGGQKSSIGSSRAVSVPAIKSPAPRPLSSASSAQSWRPVSPIVPILPPPPPPVSPSNAAPAHSRSRKATASTEDFGEFTSSSVKSPPLVASSAPPAPSFHAQLTPSVPLQPAPARSSVQQLQQQRTPSPQQSLSKADFSLFENL